jgi:two-component system chemotaxis response regulator CheY
MSKKILVVDDSLSIRQQVTHALSKTGFAIVEAIDGLDGLEKLRGAPDIAAVISDIHMPEMNGIEMLEQIKSRPECAALPVLMLTTEGSATLIQRAKALGAKGWIVKPFKPELLAAAITKILQ